MKLIYLLSFCTFSLSQPTLKPTENLSDSNIKFDQTQDKNLLDSIFHQLIHEQLDVQTAESNGVQLLMKSAATGTLSSYQLGNLKAIAWLLSNQHVHVNAMDEKKQTALFDAAFENQMEAAQFLIKQGAQVDHRGAIEDTPLVRTLVYFRCTLFLWAISIWQSC